MSLYTYMCAYNYMLYTVGRLHSVRKNSVDLPRVARQPQETFTETQVVEQLLGIAHVDGWGTSQELVLESGSKHCQPARRKNKNMSLPKTWIEKIRGFLPTN